MTFFLRFSFRCLASLPTVVVLPAPCRPAIRNTAGAGTLRFRSVADEPMTAVSSSRTTLIRAWPGASDLSTSWPAAAAQALEGAGQALGQGFEHSGGPEAENGRRL